MDLQKAIAPLGYYNERAKIFHEIANHVQNNFEEKIPNSKEDLMKIPHIGQYTAGAVLSIGFGISSSMVDSNVERIIRRFFCSIIPLKGKMSQIIKAAELLVPKKNHGIYNLALVDLGSLVCRFDKPRCDICPLKERCDLLRYSQ